MNFFDRQIAKQRQSVLLLLCFVATLVCMAFVIHGVIAGLSYLLGESGRFSQPSTQAIALIIIVWLTILAGASFRAMDVMAGGAVLARRFGAVHASDRSRYVQERQLLNVVAEVSIASSTPQPDVYVLRNESSINAFVLGSADSRFVIVVSQGALDAFDRDQLQAVVAHEFGHISNGDLPTNMRLLIALGGLMAIDEVGRLLVGDDPDDFAHPGVLVGYLLRGLGSIGVFFGQVIRAAFSRQREFLADATAVQFTRHPYALASALSLIKEHEDEPMLHGIHTQELAHLCLQSGRAKRWYAELLATHPAMQKRIDAIEPHFAIKDRKRKSENSDSATAVSSCSGLSAGSAANDGLFLSQHHSMIAGADAPLPLIAETGVSELPDRILLLLPDEKKCLAALFALFASEDQIRRRDFINGIKFGFNETFADEVLSVIQLIPDELRKDQLSIIEHSSAVIRENVTLENRQKMLLKLERLLNVNGVYDLVSYATLQLIRRKIELEFPVLGTVASDSAPIAQACHAKTFDAMGSEFALLLSLIVESSGAAATVLDDEFELVLKCYTQIRYPRRTGSEAGIVEELEEAFQTLYMQPKSIRQAFVQHCIEIVQKDGYIARKERALLDLFAASLGCEELAAA